MPLSSCSLRGQDLLAGAGAGNLTLVLLQQRAALGTDPVVERGLLARDRHDLGMPLAVLAGKLGLAPQQIGLERQQVVQHGRAADLARRGGVAANLDDTVQPGQHRLLAGACHRGGHQLAVQARDVALFGAQHLGTPGLARGAVGRRASLPPSPAAP